MRKIRGIFLCVVVCLIFFGVNCYAVETDGQAESENPYIETLYNIGVVSGNSSGDLMPDKIATYGEVVTMLSRIWGIRLANASGISYAQFVKNNFDVSQINAQAIITVNDLYSLLANVYGLNVQDVEDYIGSIQDGHLWKSELNKTIYYSLFDNTEKDFDAIDKDVDEQLTREDVSELLCRIYEIQKSLSYFPDDKTKTSKENYKIRKDARDGLKSYFSNPFIDSDFYFNLYADRVNSIDETIDMIGYIWYYQSDMFDFVISGDGNKGIDINRQDMIDARLAARRKYQEFYMLTDNRTYYFDYNCPNNEVGAVVKTTFFDTDNNGVQDVGEFVKFCEDKILQMYSSGELALKMDARDRIEKLYRHVAGKYDYDYGLSSRSGYSMAIGGNGVCSSYTAMFNMLCHIIGVKMDGVMGNVVYKDGKQGYHSWSKITMDGKTYYCDCCWGMYDSKNNEKVLKYFWSDKEFSDHIEDPVCSKY